MQRVTTTFSGPSVQGGGVCHLHFRDTGGTAAQAHAAVVTFWNGVKSLIHSGTSITVEGDVDTLSDIDGQIIGTISVPSVGIQGTGAGDMLPPNVQYLVRWRTGGRVNGREIRGRTFIPGVQRNGAAATGIPATTAVTQINTAAAALVADSNSELSVWSKTHLTQRLVTGGDAWTKFATLRSRRD